MKISQLIEHLQKVYDPDDVVAYDLWSVSDVFDEVVDLDIPDVVTEEQAVEVLELMQRYKDATVGMNWDVLNHHLGEVIAQARNALEEERKVERLKDEKRGLYPDKEDIAN